MIFFSRPFYFSRFLQFLQTFFGVCRAFGVPLAQGKTVFPTTCLEFLGTTTAMQFNLLSEKISRISEPLKSIIRKKKKVLLKDMQH